MNEEQREVIRALPSFKRFIPAERCSFEFIEFDLESIDEALESKLSQIMRSEDFVPVALGIRDNSWKQKGYWPEVAMKKMSKRMRLDEIEPEQIEMNI